MEKTNAWMKYPEGEKRTQVFDFAEDYRKFLSACKTERECTSFFEAKAKEAGYQLLEDAIKEKKSLKPGDKVYVNQMGKSIAMFIIGKESLEKGMNILGAHIDSPRLDLKQVPLYEDTEMAMFDTHYYGGVKKYQWVTLPLALHGVVAKKDGTMVNISIGDKENDPVREKSIQGHRGGESGCPDRKHSGRRRRKRQSKRDCQSKCTEYPAERI